LKNKAPIDDLPHNLAELFGLQPNYKAIQCELNVLSNRLHNILYGVRSIDFTCKKVYYEEDKINFLVHYRDIGDIMVYIAFDRMLGRVYTSAQRHSETKLFVIDQWGDTTTDEIENRAREFVDIIVCGGDAKAIMDKYINLMLKAKQIEYLDMHCVDKIRDSHSKMYGLPKDLLTFPLRIVQRER
jgi:hypothetical protein